MSVRVKAYYSCNKDKVNNRNKEWNKEHRESCRESYFRWVDKKGALAVKEYHSNWRKNNRHLCVGYSTKWAKLHWEKHKAIQKSVQAARSSSEGRFSCGDWLKLIKCCGYCCVCCGMKFGATDASRRRGGLHADHIVPTSKGGTSYIWNIQPLCQSCNLHKLAKAIDYRSQRVRELFAENK